MGGPDPRQPVASFHPSANALGLGQWEFWGGPELRPLKAYDNVLGSFLSMDHLGKRSTERQRVGAISLFRNERSGESHTFLLEYNVFSVVRDATSFLHSLPPRQGPLGRPKAFVTCSSPAMTSRYTELCTAVPSAWDVLPHSARLSLIKLQFPESGWEWAKERSLCPDLAVPEGLRHEFS